jgi:hypothetical protein
MKLVVRSGKTVIDLARFEMLTVEEFPGFLALVAHAPADGVSITVACFSGVDGDDGQAVAVAAACANSTGGKYQTVHFDDAIPCDEEMAGLIAKRLTEQQGGPLVRRSPADEQGRRRAEFTLLPEDFSTGGTIRSMRAAIGMALQDIEVVGDRITFKFEG